MKAGRWESLDSADGQQIADCVPRQTTPADLERVSVKTRAPPIRDFFEVEIERRREETLVNRQTPYPTGGIGQGFRDIAEPYLDTGVSPLLAHPAPIAGKRLPLEKPVLRRNRLGVRSEYEGADDHQRREAGSHEKSEFPTLEDQLWAEQIHSVYRGP